MFIEWTLQESSRSPSYLSDIVLYYLHDINWFLELLKIFFLWSILNSPSIKFSFKCLCYLIWSILSLFPYHLTKFWTCKCREYFYPRVSIGSILEFFPVANKKWIKIFLFSLTWPYKNFIECISFRYGRTIIVWHSYCGIFTLYQFPSYLLLTITVQSSYKIYNESILLVIDIAFLSGGCTTAVAINLFYIKSSKMYGTHFIEQE